uniref:Reverse transcriptase domain-containing protein n=1 Tax=Meloidogyne incognita TaxID=6306 RepID=A0A914NU80_MELIC
MLNDFYNVIQENKSIDIVYIDFAKAFDSVPINRILYKLKSIGIAGKIYTFIKNFLENRTFRVKIENTLSDSYPTLSGVPQGSVLGPLLFLIYINDLPKYLHEGIHIKIYADDVKLYIEHNNDLRTEVLSEALSCIEQWSFIN